MGTCLSSGWGLLIGLLSAVSDSLQRLGSLVSLGPIEFVPEEPGPSDDECPLSELLERRSSLQSL